MDLGDTIQPITSEPQFPHLLTIGQSRPQRLTVKVERETMATPACQAAIGQKMEAPHFRRAPTLPSPELFALRGNTCSSANPPPSPCPPSLPSAWHGPSPSP